MTAGSSALAQRAAAPTAAKPVAAKAATGKPGAPAVAGKKPAKAEPFPELAGDKTKVDLAAAKADLVGLSADKAILAAKHLARLGGPAALDALLDALATGLDPDVAAVAVEAVGWLRSSAAIDVLGAYAHHRRPAVRAKAVWALGQLEDRRAIGLAYAALADQDKTVRAAACKVVEDRRDGSQADALVNLLGKGDDAVAPALAAIATPDLARRLAELFGQVPDQLLARTLGLIILRPDLGKEDTYVELVIAIGKIPGEEAIAALATFVSKTPETPPRASRKKAQAIYDQRMGGGAK